MKLALEAGAEDVAGDDGIVIVTCAPADLIAVRKALEEGGIEVVRSESVLRPTTIPLEAEGLTKVMKLVDALEELDDVQKVSTNLEASDAAMEAVYGG